MPKVVLPTYTPELQLEDVGRVLEQQFAGKYQVQRTGGKGRAYKVFPNPWKGAMVRLKQDAERQQTTIIVWGRVPEMWARIALVAIVWLPLVIADTVASRGVVQDVVNALQTSPELGGPGTEAPPPPPPTASLSGS